MSSSQCTRLTLITYDAGNKSNSTISSKSDGHKGKCNKIAKEMKVLDLYSGCGAMSTGLRLGASKTGFSLVTVC